MSAPSLDCARALVDEWVRAGLREACLAPGSRSAPLALALFEHPDVRLHVRIDERSAAFTALGLARASGDPVLVTCTSGSAAANLHPAVVEAFHGRVGLLVVTADRPPELRDVGANQTITQAGLFGAATRWSVELGVPEGRGDEQPYWRSCASQAWAAATGGLTGASGPVHVNLPLRDPLVAPPPDAGAITGGRADGRVWTRTARSPRHPAEEALAALAGAVAGIERGLVLVGDATTCDADVDALLGLADRAGWPVLSEPHGNARRGAAAISTGAALLGLTPFAAAHRPELLVVAGRVGLSRRTTQLLRSAGEVVVVDPDARFIDPVRRVNRVLGADLVPLAEALHRRLDSLDFPRRRSDWWASWQRAEAAARSALDALLDGEPRPSEPRTARDLAACLPSGALLLAASSRPVRDLDLTMTCRDGLRVVANRGASGIDGLVSTAVGLALAHGGPTAALLGDLAFLHDHNGLLLGDAVQPDLVLVVADNDGGGIFSDLEQAERPDAFEALFGTPHRLDLERVAQAAGWRAQAVERAAQLPGAVLAALAAGGGHVLVVRTDRAESRALRRQVGRRVAAALQDDLQRPTSG